MTVGSSKSYTSVVTAVPEFVSLLELINKASGIWYMVIDLMSDFFFIPTKE